MIAKIIANRMIQLNYSNREIAEVLELSVHTIINFRYEYNRSAGIPIVSKHRKPRFGTVAREVYEILVEQPTASDAHIVNITGANRGTIWRVRTRHFK